MATTAAMAAIAASSRHNSPYAHHKRPTPLSINTEDDNEPRFDGRPRRLSLGAESSDDEDSPILSALDSSAALILVHDDDAQDAANHFEFSDDDGDPEEHDDIVSPIFEIRRTSIPPLPPTTVFLYLLAPFLKLGALSILPAGAELPLRYGLPALFVLAIASAFSRQIWYLLARYLRKADLTEILCDTFAKARGKERQRRIVRLCVRVGTAVYSSFLAILYLHESIHLLLPYLPQPILLRLLVILICGTTVFFLSLGPSLGSKRVVFASWLSILIYVAWLICASFAHAKGSLFVESGWIHGTPSVWKGIFAIAFTFCTSSSLPLYASLKSGRNPVSTTKTPRSRSFRILSFISVLCATLLILPIVIFAAKPNIPATRSSSLQIPHFLEGTLLGKLPHIDPSIKAIRTALASLSAAILLLGTPQPLLTIPALPIRVARTTINLTRTLLVPSIIILTLVFSLLSPTSFGLHFITFLALTTVALALTSTYILPCILHICVHFFKRPVSIVVPRTPMLPTTSTPATSTGPGPGVSPDATPRTLTDELLLRKERALQRKQFRKRIVWDVGVWVQLGVFAVGGALAAASLVSR
ncbi:hypothetical protein DFP72DRAFT_1074939 [Ephemerocybe angulata]|uniref:Uncharacterized protein n=1 Tax=Ephemerocybe angulata TaxID=980116 RepID=A0A8H6HKI2_9AGAR|nr:hypothetical protein DFP72DRAFT_1074939 [Tulosesus angulatus]